MRDSIRLFKTINLVILTSSEQRIDNCVLNLHLFKRLSTYCVYFRMQNYSHQVLRELFKFKIFAKIIMKYIYKNKWVVKYLSDNLYIYIFDNLKR